MKVMLNILVLIVCLGCAPMSEQIRDETAGMNGGFEQTRDGLPVNWRVYTPATVPRGNYELILDREDYKEGRQSLKFVVHECSADGGWRSPGLTRELPAEPGRSYRIRFWIKSDGSDYVVSAGGVAPKVGEMETIHSSEKGAASWNRVERVVTVREPYDSLRFQLNVLSPGTLWIDDVTIDPIVEEERT